MADIEVHRAHGLGLAAARRAAEQMAADLGRKFDVRAAWQGDTLRFERPGASGFVTLGEKDLRLSLSLGFLLKAMKPSIEKLIHEELESLFKEPPRPSASARPPRPATPRKAAKRRRTGG